VVCLEKILENPLLIKKLTGYINSDFEIEFKKYKRKNKKRSFHKVLNSTRKQFLFIKFLEHVPMTDPLIAILLGVKDARRIFDWRKSLDIKINPLKSKLKVLGEFLQLYPDIQEAIIVKDIHVPFQINTTAVDDEHSRLEKVLGTESERASVLMMFRKEVMNRDKDISIDTFILDRYNDKYGTTLQSMSLKEMAYLWGVSIEYMTRVLNIALDKLDLDKKELFERLIIGY
jgi:hypothetical protein